AGALGALIVRTVKRHRLLHHTPNFASRRSTFCQRKHYGLTRPNRGAVWRHHRANSPKSVAPIVRLGNAARRGTGPPSSASAAYRVQLHWGRRPWPSARSDDVTGVSPP